MLAEPTTHHHFRGNPMSLQAQTTDADVVAAFEAKVDEIAKANGWTIGRTETLVLKFLRDNSPAEAATVAAALAQRNGISA